METLGSLVDKLTIEKIRISKLYDARESLNSTIEQKVITDKMDIVSGKIGHLKQEINELFIRPVALADDKIKFYKHEKPSDLTKVNSIGALIYNLADTNLELWKLEDIRRDKEKYKPEERLAAADNISTLNRMRNDCIDKINHTFIDLIAKK